MTTRLNIQKTYKIFIGGAFPRTESGRYYPLENADGELIANMCLSSRKDLRNAVVAARKAQPGWANKTAYNRAQILYRLAEMLESRHSAFVDELVRLGSTKKEAASEVDAAIDRLVYYAGWCDKYTALFSSVNPTASAHFNFSVHEATGVVGVVAPEEQGLLGLVSVVAPLITGGNAVVVLASEQLAPVAISFAEVIQNSDVPGGVINILTGKLDELETHFTSHMDINALAYARPLSLEARLKATTNIKRMLDWTEKWNDASPYPILDAQEVKTTWHPVQTSKASGGGY